MRRIKGFTLIELMIAIVVIGVLISFAVFNYKNSIKKAKRVDMQSEMIRISQRMQTYKVINHNYGDVTLTSIGVEDEYPAKDPVYELSLTDIAGKALDDPDANTQTWRLIATPIDAQKGDGHLVLNNNNQKCWLEGSDNNSNPCIPTSTTNWDSR